MARVQWTVLDMPPDGGPGTTARGLFSTQEAAEKRAEKLREQFVKDNDGDESGERWLYISVIPVERGK